MMFEHHRSVAPCHRCGQPTYERPARPGERFHCSSGVRPCAPIQLDEWAAVVIGSTTKLLAVFPLTGVTDLDELGVVGLVVVREASDGPGFEVVRRDEGRPPVRVGVHAEAPAAMSLALDEAGWLDHVQPLDEWRAAERDHTDRPAR